MRIIKHKCGFTLVEVVVTIAVLLVVSLGAISYQYHAVRQAKIGRAKIAAARLGSLILESWKSQGGSDAYDPTTLDLGIAKSSTGEKYLLVVGGIPFYLELYSKDIDSNETTGVILRELSVFVQWRPDYEQQIPQSSDPSSMFYTYVRQDQSGG